MCLTVNSLLSEILEVLVLSTAEVHLGVSDLLQSFAELVEFFVAFENLDI